MIRFIDLRFQGTQHRFAFWDTATNRFVTLGTIRFLIVGTLSGQAWKTWDEFESAVRLPVLEEGPTEDLEEAYIGRFRELCPPWAFEPPTEEELDFKASDASGPTVPRGTEVKR